MAPSGVMLHQASHTKNDISGRDQMKVKIDQSVKGLLLRRLFVDLTVRVGFVIFTLLSWVYLCIHRLPGMRPVTMFVLTWTLRLIRWHMDGYWTKYSRNRWLPDKDSYAQDESYVMAGVAPIDTIAYGDHPREFFHVVRPATAKRVYVSASDGPGPTPRCCSVPEKSKRVILYVHGGGFVCASSAVLLHSVTVFARQGFTVYSTEYPLAPEDPFPSALLSTLRALRFLHHVKGVTQVFLLGDSAGATLVSMASALILNRHLLAELALEVNEPLTEWNFPRIERQVVLYGLLDQDSWKHQKVAGMGSLENALAVMGLHSCLALYHVRLNVFRNRLTLLDLLPDIKRLPPTYIIGADKDALVFSSRTAYERLKHAGFDVHYKAYNSRHGFFGFPPAWTFGNWKTSAKPCAVLIGKFFTPGRSGP